MRKLNPMVEKCSVCRVTLCVPGERFLCKKCLDSYHKQDMNMFSVIEWAAKRSLRAELKRVKARPKRKSTTGIKVGKEYWVRGDAGNGFQVRKAVVKAVVYGDMALVLFCDGDHVFDTVYKIESSRLHCDESKSIPIEETLALARERIGDLNTLHRQLEHKIKEDWGR